MADGQPSHLRAALRLILEGVRRRNQPGRGAGAVPRRKLAVERRGIAVDPARVHRFLSVTSGSGITALHGEEALLPPTYPAVWETALALELLSLEDAPLPWRGLVHLDGEMVCIRPLRAGDRVRCRVELERAEPHPRGVYLALKSRNWNEADQLCREGLLGLLVRTTAAPAAPPARPAPAEESGGVEWRELASWTLPASQGRRYARVSGDFNPIHLWSWSSRLLGFDRPILHGYCTEALVAHALVERLLGGQPDALRRLRISFRTPLALPARVRLLVGRHPAGGGGRFRVVDAVDDGPRRPYAEGEFVGSAG